MQKTCFGFFLAMSLVYLAGCGTPEATNLPPPNTLPAPTTQDYPSVVRVFSMGQLCSGIIVSPRAILTASHCVGTKTQVTVQTLQFRIEGGRVVKNGPGTEGDFRDLAVIILPQAISLDYSSLYPIGSVATGETVHMVGFGCSDAISRQGSGIKRAGTNTLYRVSQYLEVLSPVTPPTSRGILGPVNRAGSCFGDSGGPMLKPVGSSFQLVGIDHAIIPENGQQISAYTNLTRQENFDFLKQVNTQYQLGILGL